MTASDVLKKKCIVFRISITVLLKHKLYLTNNCNCCCETVKLSKSSWKAEITASAFVH